jgi:acyl-CoA reductase-like NAD-dependent aldehyde dehydrogenase
VETFDNRNPANTDEVVGQFVKGRPADVAAAAEAAQRALPEWSNLPAPARGAFLFRVEEILESRFDEISPDMTSEEDKTLPESMGEVRRSINIFRYFAGEGSRLLGILPLSERARVQMFALRKAIGVGSGYSVEFPQRDSGLEAGPGADLREYGRDETRIGHALERLASGRSLPSGGRSKGSSEFHRRRRR